MSKYIHFFFRTLLLQIYSNNEKILQKMEEREKRHMWFCRPRWQIPSEPKGDRDVRKLSFFYEILEMNLLFCPSLSSSP